MTDIDLDDFLAHYGVKGMKWGVRRSSERSAARSAKNDEKVSKRAAELKKIAAGYQIKRAPTESLRAERAKIQKRIDRMDMNDVYDSLGYGAASKRADKLIDSSGKKAYQKLSAREKHNVDSALRTEAHVKAAMKAVATGAAAAAVYVGGLNFVLSNSGYSASTINKGRAASVTMVGGTIAKLTASELSAIHTSYKFKTLSGRRQEIDWQLKESR